MRSGRPTCLGSDGRETIPDRAHGVHERHAPPQQRGRKMAGIHFAAVAPDEAGARLPNAVGKHGIDGAGQEAVSEFVRNAAILPTRRDLWTGGVGRTDG